ncbi:MAG: tetratricopeptide repeat protein [Tidjanibacter sp.]|nr:tetratricopeptide repeat protein [Tidjanibacter sp.]
MSRVLKYLLPLLALFVATTAYGQKYPERKHVRRGNSLYEEQRMEEAQKEYRTALQKDAASVEGKFNLGDSQYAMGDFESAENTFRELSEYPNLSDEVKAKTLYNLGNAQFQQQKLEEALESYKSSLRLNPKDMEAKFNYAYTKAMMENQQNNDQNQQNNQNNQNNQNQQSEGGEDDEKGDKEQNPNEQPQPEDQQGEKPEPSDQDEEPQETPAPRPESEQMLDAVQAAEDKTREKVDGEKAAVMMPRSGKNW